MALYGNSTSPKIEAQIGGTWTDISARVRGDEKAVITRGRQNEQSRTTAQTCALTLENPDGYFSNRNPASVNYGLLPKNTQLRVSAGTGDIYLRLQYNDTADLNNISTADKASLDVVGDTDVRIDIQPHTWRPRQNMILMSKWQIGSSQRSWVFYIGTDGLLKFAWTTDGTLGTRTTTTSTVAVPYTSGRLAVRAALDVDNGAAGNNVLFYTASSITGSWTQLGTTVTTAGVTSVFSGAADIVVGGGDDNAAIFSDGMAFGGKVFKAELWNAAAVRVANMDATARSLGDTSWSDGLTSPNTWTIGGSGRITTDRLRFWGELSSLPKRWDKSGANVFIPATASGMIRRLTQGATPINSPIYRNFGQYTPHGYWPLEDGSDATAATSAVAGGTAASVTGVRFANAETLPGAVTTVAFTGSTGRISGTSNSATSTGIASFVFYIKVSALPATTATICTLTTIGTIRRIDIGLNTTSWVVTFYDKDGTTLSSTTTPITLISPLNQWIGYNLLLQTSGADTTYAVRWDVVGGTFGGGVGPTTIVGSTFRPFSSFTLQAAADSTYNDAQFGHVFMSTQNLDLSTSDFRLAANAYLSETAAARMDRLCGEEGIAFEVTGYYSESEAMGYQGIDTFMNLVYECWDADGGIGGEARDALLLTYRTRADVERRYDATLSYTSAHLSEVPEPTDDDQGLVNDVTVKRTNAGSARSVVASGANSVLSPPSGVGRYDTQVTLNVATDARLPSIAGWMTLVGTWDQDRYPLLSVALHRTALTSNSTLTGQVTALDLGDTVTLTGLPAWMPPDSVYELVQGYTETLGRFTWDINYNATPAGPYRSSPSLNADDFVIRLDGNGHTIGGSLTTVATSVSLVTPSGSARWVDSATYPAEFPFDVLVAGERMTITAITGTASPQTATVTRSVNTVVKTHASGEAIGLADPYFVGR